MNNKIKRPLLIVFFLTFFFSSHLAAAPADTKESSNKSVITILPLNVTADKNTRTTIQKSAERFLLHRLNGQNFQAETAEKLKSVSPDDLNDIYTDMNAGKVDEKMMTGENDYICGGNVVVLGSSVMTDFFLFSVDKKTRMIEHSASGNDLGTVLTAAELFSTNVKSDFSKKIEKPVIEIIKPEPKTMRPAEPERKILLKSDKVDGEITAVVFSRLDASEKPYAVYAQKDRISVLRINESELVLKADYQNSDDDMIIGLASIDTDQDGLEELVVSNLKDDQRTISSYILKWEGDALKKVSGGINWIFSASNSDEFLYAQKHQSLKTTLDSGVYKAVFKKGQLSLSESKLNLPKWVLLPGLSVNPVENLFYGAAFRPDNRLRVFTENGDVFWESSDAFGGSKNFFKAQHDNQRERELKKHVWLHSPVRITDLFGGNKYPEVITVNNIDATKGFLAGVRSFNESTLSVYGINELSCELIAQSNKISGYISSFDIDSTTNKDTTFFLYSVTQKGKTFFSDDKSFIVIQDLSSLNRTR